MFVVYGTSNSRGRTFAKARAFSIRPRGSISIGEASIPDLYETQYEKDLETVPACTRECPYDGFKSYESTLELYGDLGGSIFFNRLRFIADWRFVYEKILGRGKKNKGCFYDRGEQSKGYL